MALKNTLHFPASPLYLIDGSSFLYRGFYAFRDMSRSDGLPTNTLFYNLRILFRLLREEKPKYLGFILDGKGRNFRHALYKEYKANRPSMPEPLQLQIEPLKEAVRLLGISLTVADEVEADDCIASLSKTYKKDRPIVILGSDKDLKQCLDDNVFLWNPLGKQKQILTLQMFQEESGLSPEQWPDFQAIIGDSADNIPGIPGIGPKTAQKIFAQCPTLESLQAKYQTLPTKLAAKIEPYLDKIFIFRELTRMKTDCCSQSSLDSFSVSPPSSAMGDFLRNYELRTLLNEFEAMYPELRQETETPPTLSKQTHTEHTQLSLFTGSTPSAQTLQSFTQHPVSSTKDLPAPDSLCVGLVLINQTVYLGIQNTEYTYHGQHDELITWLNKTKSIVIPDLHELYRNSPAWEKISLNNCFDLALVSYLLNPEERNYTWNRLKGQLVHPPTDAVENQITEAIHPEAQGLAALAYADVLRPKLAAAGFTDLIRSMEIPLVPVLSTMERNGITLDLKAFNNFLSEVIQDIERLTHSIHTHAETQFNIRSNQQLATILFEKLGLKPAGKTSGGQFSTSVQVLEKIKNQHPIIENILEFRTLEKLRSTYLEPLPRMADQNSRIHTRFNRLMTATGRLSSSNPNLQNIPIRGAQGKRMRACFTATQGMALIAADYSQVELRVLAHFSQDPALLTAFNNDEDIHAHTAALIFDKDSPQAVTHDERRNAKTINFGLIYGMGAQRLSHALGVGLREAKDFIDRYFSRLSTLGNYYEQLVSEATQMGYVVTLAGRRRLLPELHSRNQQLVSQARRQAINTVIQGSAADIIKLAMLAVYEDTQLKQLQAKLLLQVHDELLMEAPTEAAQDTANTLKDIMQSVVDLKVPLKVDAGLGHTWAEAH